VKTLQFYVARRVGLYFAVILVACLLIGFHPLLLTAISRLGGVPLRTILEYLPYQSMELFPYLLPVILSLAVTATYCTLSSNGEWTAMAFSGMHPLRGVLPALALALATSYLSCELLTRVFPALRYQQRVMINEASRQTLESLFPGQTQVRIDDFALIGRERNGNFLYDVVIHIPGSLSESGPRRLTAKRVLLGFENRTLSLRLYGAWAADDLQDVKVEEVLIEFQEDRVLRLREVDASKDKFLSSTDLRRGLNSPDLDERTRAEHLFEYHRRYALGFSALFLTLCSIVTGLGFRRYSLFSSMTASMLCACVYFLTTIRLGEELGLSGKVAPWLGAWSTNILYGLTGGAAVFRILRR
jgi:lipopolysaccharide export LptBFGC system permease protein LptF